MNPTSSAQGSSDESTQTRASAWSPAAMAAVASAPAPHSVGTVLDTPARGRSRTSVARAASIRKLRHGEGAVLHIMARPRAPPVPMRVGGQRRAANSSGRGVRVLRPSGVARRSVIAPDSDASEAEAAVVLGCAKEGAGFVTKSAFVSARVEHCSIGFARSKAGRMKGSIGGGGLA
ncbi:unnamed protein product [Mycena citricolor]|uniref:Uncharacterized protein n=1 Tax=Mycena citricolor TaxID=2018698 RepID=A0AAD2K4I4_9AGAR|nr:unnamed protein product [Mycena citricolor]